MAVKKNPFRQIRIMYRRSSTLLKCVVLTAIVLSTICLIALRGAILDEQNRAENLRKEAAQLEQKNKRLEQYLSEIGTVEGIKNIAFDRLDLVDPDTIIFQPEG